MPAKIYENICFKFKHLRQCNEARYGNDTEGAAKELGIKTTQAGEVFLTEYFIITSGKK